MARQLEDTLYQLAEVGLNSAKDGTLSGAITFSGANTYSGATTLSGTTTISGDASFTGATNGLRTTPEIQLTGTGDTLLAAESGKIIIATKASATQTFVLPAATVAGCTFTFKCGHASGEILIDPAGSDVIQAKATNDAGADITPAGGTGIKNTAASNIIGDYITLVADGVSKWYTVAQSGIFASQ